MAIRKGDYKIIFREQNAHGLNVSQNRWTELRAPKLFNLRMDPFERMEDESDDYARWFAEHILLIAPSMFKVAAFKATFKEYPQRQKPGSFVP